MLHRLLMHFCRFLRRLVVQPIGKTTTPSHNERRNEEQTKRRTRKQQNDAALRYIFPKAQRNASEHDKRRQTGRNETRRHILTLVMSTHPLITCILRSARRRPSFDVHQHPPAPGSAACRRHQAVRPLQYMPKA